MQKHLGSMSRQRPLPMRFLPTLVWDALAMAGDGAAARRGASHWYIRLREEEHDEALKSEFADWLRADPLHSEAWTDMCKTMEVVGRAPAGWRSYSFPGSGQRHHAALRAPERRKRRIRVAVGAVAAACALVLALPAISLHLRADYITGAGHIASVRLADGSIVQVGPDSAIAVDYSDHGRTVRLMSGQALFDVKHDPSRPFRVQAGQVTTTVLGTKFDVRMLGDATSVAVARGHVRVDDRGATPAAMYDLLPGDWVRIDGAHRGATGKVAPQLVGGWGQGEALAENRTIASVVDEIRPWFGGRIILNDARLAGRRVTGIYNVKDPEKALEMIVQPYGGHISRITPWVLIVSGN